MRHGLRQKHRWILDSSLHDVVLLLAWHWCHKDRVFIVITMTEQTERM